MKISKVVMTNFKYFDDLTIIVPPEKKVVLLVGPNGCGKSCVFDAFTNYIRPAKGRGDDSDNEYLRKDKEKSHGINIFDENGSLIDKTYNKEKQVQFYGRTAYRFTKDITRQNLTHTASNAVKTDANSPERFNDLDQRLEDDIESALGEILTQAQIRDKTTNEIIDGILKPINISLENIFGRNGIQVERLLNPHDGRGGKKIDVLFKKDKKEFLYKNLSAGEKEVFDIIFNFYRRVDYHIKNGIYFIDEPELHIHASIQKKLLGELSRLCQEYDAQLWVATHSIGFIKAAHESNDASICVYEFSPELASGTKTLEPLKLNWRGWQQIFKTPLDDLATLTLPRVIIYCEGDTNKTGFYEKIYNIIFGKAYPEAIFISSGGKTQPLDNSLLATIVFKKLSSKVNLLILKDRDKEHQSDEARGEWLANTPQGRMLKRLEIENYLLDYDVLKVMNPEISKENYDDIVGNVFFDDLKLVKQKLKLLCKDQSQNCNDFMEKLAEGLQKTSIYTELEEVIFSK